MNDEVEIEVTPEMIEAALLLHRLYWFDVNDGYSDEHFAEYVSKFVRLTSDWSRGPKTI